MSELAQLSISNLLSQVGIVKKKYDDLAAYTGENYNLFSVLKIYTQELSHSAILGDLLNAKGKHGQKDTFLKLFLEGLPTFKEGSEQFKVLQNFKSDKSIVFIEKYAGKVNYQKEEGGRIDIVINDQKTNIIIENKILAGDQPLQLKRYNEWYKSAPIIYLTLNGKEPSNESKKDLKLNEHFICISYQENIKNWLEKCIKEMANKPIIRESLNQYLVLVKQLTNQSTNNKMKEETINILTKSSENIMAAKMIADNYKLSVIELNKIQIQKLVTIFNQNGFNLNEENIKRASREDGDGVFIPMKEFTLTDGDFELGINVELIKNHFFFCVLRKNDNRKDDVNTNIKFQDIKNYLHSKIPNLSQVNLWTIGMANDYVIGIDETSFFYPETDNSSSFEELVLRIKELKEILNN
jgi:hypothetical protein